MAFSIKDLMQEISKLVETRVNAGTLVHRDFLTHEIVSRRTPPTADQDFWLLAAHAFVGSKVEEIILRYTMNRHEVGDQPLSSRKGVFEGIRREICHGDANSSAHKISVMHKQIHKAGQPRSLVKEADSLAMVAAGEGPQYDMNTIDEFSRIIDEAIRTYFDRESV